MPPSGVNLTALSARLMNTCRSRSGSPCTGGRSPSTSALETMALLARLGRQRRDGLGEQLPMCTSPCAAHGAALELGEIEQAHDEPRSCSLLSWMVSTNSLCSSLRPGDALGEHLAVADDRGERRAQLVGDGGEEVRLEAIELLEPLVGLLRLLVLLVELAVALAHAGEVHLRREERLVAAEEDEVERPPQVIG